MTNIRKQITKPRGLNEEEFADQITHMGDAHNVESQEEFKKAVQGQMRDMHKRYDDGENDAYMQDVVLGAKLNKVAKYENHESRWERQHKLALELDAVNDELHKHAMGSDKYEDLMAKRVALESLL